MENKESGLVKFPFVQVCSISVVLNQCFIAEFSQSSVSSRCLWFSSKFSRINAEDEYVILGTKVMFGIYALTGNWWVVR